MVSLTRVWFSPFCFLSLNICRTQNLAFRLFLRCSHRLLKIISNNNFLLLNGAIFVVVFGAQIFSISCWSATKNSQVEDNNANALRARALSALIGEQKDWKWRPASEFIAQSLKIVFDLYKKLNLDSNSSSENMHVLKISSPCRKQKGPFDYRWSMVQKSFFLWNRGGQGGHGPSSFPCKENVFKNLLFLIKHIESYLHNGNILFQIYKTFCLEAYILTHEFESRNPYFGKFIKSKAISWASDCVQ